MTSVHFLFGFCTVWLMFNVHALYWMLFSLLLISAPRLGVYYCQQLTLSVHLSVTLLQIAYSFSRWNQAIFWPSFLHVPFYKTSFFDFWFRPPNAQNLLPKFCTKSPISRLVWQTDRWCLGLPGGSRGWPIQWNHAKCCGAYHCCHGNEIWAMREDPSPYRLVLSLFFLECLE